MSIKARLALNALLVILGIGTIAGIGVKSIVSIRSSVDHLTRNSTPQQVKTLQIQEAVEKLSAEFLRLGIAQNLAEANQISKDVTQQIEEIKRLGADLQQLNGSSGGLDIGGYENLRGTVIKAVREKLAAIHSFQSEADNVSRSLRGVETSLAGIHAQVGSLNANSFGVVRSSQQTNLKLNTAVKKALSVQYKLKDIEAVLSEIDATRSKYKLTPFKEKVKAAADAIQNQPLDSTDLPIFSEAKTTAANIYTQVTKEPGGLLVLKAQALSAKESEDEYNNSKTALLGILTALSRKLNDVVDPLELQMMKSRTSVEHALDLQQQIGQVVSSAAIIEIGAKELNAQVRVVMLSSTLVELQSKQASLLSHRERITNSIRTLQSALSRTGQNSLLRAAGAISTAIRDTNASTDKIIAAKRNVLASDGLMLKTFANVSAIARQQSRTGGERLKDVTQKQNETVANVNERVRSSLSLLLVLSLVIIVVAIGFSLAMSVAIIRPLNSLSRTVLAVAEKSDFSQRVTLKRRDEVGKTVKAFNQLMESLQSAFTRINSVMDNVAEGDFAQRVDGELNGDLNTLKGSINTSVDRLQLAMTNINDVMEGVAQGDFTRQIDVPLAGDLDTLKRSINASVESVREAIRDINQVMNGLSQGDFSREVSAPLRGELGELKASINQTVAQLRETMAVLSEAMRALAKGDFKASVVVTGEGEFKQNIETTLKTMQTLDAVIGEINQVMSHVAVGDLTPRVRVKASGELQRLSEGINTSLESLQTTLSLVHKNTLHVSDASAQTAHTVDTVSEGVQSRAVTVNQLVNALEQTTQAITQVLENTDTARQSSDHSASLVREGQQRVQSMLESVRQIATNNQRIGSITQVITSIADQTQLLSLNATIEAARAGDQGRGFAVVAQEISKLAEQVSLQAVEIKTLINAANNSSADGVKVASTVSDEMNEIVRNVLNTHEALQSITQAMEKQTCVVGEMQVSVSSLQNVVEADAAAAQQMASSMSELSCMAQQTREQVEQFKVA